MSSTSNYQKLSTRKRFSQLGFLLIFLLLSDVLFIKSWLEDDGFREMMQSIFLILLLVFTGLLYSVCYIYGGELPDYTATAFFIGIILILFAKQIWKKPIVVYPLITQCHYNVKAYRSIILQFSNKNKSDPKITSSLIHVILFRAQQAEKKGEYLLSQTLINYAKTIIKANFLQSLKK